MIIVLNILLILPLILGVLCLLQPYINDQTSLINTPIAVKTGVIDINSNGEFAAYATAGGAGNVTHPWIIENYVIEASGQAKRGIEIHATTAYFIIRNCTITNTDSSYYGMYIESAQNGLVTNCTVKSCGDYDIVIEDGININVTNNKIGDNTGYIGILLQDSSTCNIINNTITKCYDGIQLFSQYSCSNNLIYNNTLKENFNAGIRTRILSMGYICSFNNFSSNTAILNKIGYQLSDAYNCTLLNNYAENSTFEGIKLDNAHNSSVLLNILINNGNGIQIYYTNTSVISNNVVCNSTNYGIELDNSYHNLITFNTLQCNTEGCISTDNSNVYNTIENNDCITDGCDGTGGNGGIPGFAWLLSFLTLSLTFVLIHIRKQKILYCC